ncbi:YbaB/EbfC DNA-binding family protein [Stackebrandtia albiflava]|uniref:YbaB/EbfC DNA-binding family protein n=1 Tax=Stackebrandtia albiflava TaxID=406432 RepID=A0A562UR06_9ACTN|nr:YbaB/EbfC family nucleoid-associated protein [Stackebrandtia albiflava]TWJ08063.1 YbaB/EbfC DNA-binding family protein [Stackebrandtia albiflava]
MTDEDFWERDRAAWRDAASGLAAAEKKSIQAVYGAESANRLVRVVMKGDFRLAVLGIHPGAYEAMTEDELGDAVISAYNNARRAVHRGQLEHLLHASRQEG